MFYNTVYYLYGHAHIQSIPDLFFDLLLHLYFQTDIYGMLLYVLQNTVYYLYGHAHIQSIPDLFFDLPLHQKKIGLGTRLTYSIYTHLHAVLIILQGADAGL